MEEDRIEKIKSALAVPIRPQADIVLTECEGYAVIARLRDGTSWLALGRALDLGKTSRASAVMALQKALGRWAAQYAKVD